MARLIEADALKKAIMAEPWKNEPKLFYYCPNCGSKMDLEVKDV